MTVYVLMAGDDPIGVFNSREAAITAHAQCYTNGMHLHSRYLRWYLWPFEINKSVIWCDAVEVSELVEPFAWGETLITTETREQILAEWHRS